MSQSDAPGLVVPIPNSKLASSFLYQEPSFLLDVQALAFHTRCSRLDPQLMASFLAQGASSYFPPFGFSGVFGGAAVPEPPKR